MPHIHDLIDFTVEVFIVNKNKVLLRKHDKYKIWLSIGGHIELNEDPNQAAIREVKEEMGLDIKLYDGLRPFEKDLENEKELIPPFFMNRHRINENHEHVTFVFFASVENDQIKQGETEVSDDYGWFTESELDELNELKEGVKFYAKKALSVLSKF